MGLTSKSIEVIEIVLSKHEVKSVCEIGAQNLYDKDYGTKFPYASSYYKEKGIEYTCIDLNGENDALQYDLSEPVKTNKTYDLVTDFGTSEHVDNLYQCFANAHKLCKVGGIMIHENPKTGNWPKHGFHYFTPEFYRELAKEAKYELILLEEHPAMGNIDDGWNVIAVLKKTQKDFISKDKFPKAEKK